MSNTRKYGKHSPDCVHRVIKRGKKAGARKRGQLNRRLIVIGKAKQRGPFMRFVKVLGIGLAQQIEVEKQYHYTKGYRTRAA